MFCKNTFELNIKNAKTFLVIGANKANSSDDIFIKDDLEYCVLIEPLPMCVEFLKEKYKNDDRYEIYDFAISEEESIQDMITVKDLNNDLIGSSSLIKFVKNNITNILGEDKNNIVSVKTITLNKLKNNFKLNAFDVIQVDTEGYDKIIFDQIIENKIIFKNIKLETMWLNNLDKEKIHIELIKNNFFIYDDGCNLLAYESKQ